MGITKVSVGEVREKTLRDLGLNPVNYDLSSTEALSAIMRRAARFLCPSSPRTLINEVTQSLRGLLNDEIDLAMILEALISSGDLLEVKEEQQTLIFLGPPTFVRREGSVIILGSVPEYRSPVDPELEEQIQWNQHLRRIPRRLDDDLIERLQDSGLIEISIDAWLRLPRFESPESLITKMDRLLESSGTTGHISNLQILDPNTPVNFYRRRWTEAKKQNGHFVARRPQAYGSDLWCYIQLTDGEPSQLLDFPRNQAARGCDEAWRLQLAIDSVRGVLQIYRRRALDSGRTALDFFSPVPGWAKRRWDLIAEPMHPDRSLFSYSFDSGEIDEEERFCTQRLWMTAVKDHH